MLDVVNVGCTRGDRPLFKGLSFALKRGELLHITGRNGSGKTTLLRTLSGLSRPAEGRIQWDRIDTRRLGDEYHRQIGFVGHSNGIQGELTAEENLRHAACMAGAASTGAIASTLDTLGLSPYGHLPTKLLSQGQKRRLALARLILLRNPFWILDEPFTGLDVQSRDLMERLLQDHLAAEGLAIITSHHKLSLHAGQSREIDIESARP